MIYFISQVSSTAEGPHLLPRGIFVNLTDAVVERPGHSHSKPMPTMEGGGVIDDSTVLFYGDPRNGLGMLESIEILSIMF